MILTITDDFDLDRIADSGQCFRWERLSAGSYRVLNGGSCVYVEDLGDRRFAFSCNEGEFKALWHDYFDLAEDYAAIRSRIDPGADPFLWSAAEQEKGIRILRQDPWETLVTFILSQNRNIPAIRRSVEMLCERFGERRVDARGREYRAFPGPAAVAALDEAELAACRIGYRCRYVRDAADAVAGGRLDLDRLRGADDEETIRELSRITGVGIKVASCVALFGFHHIDAFPRDVWIKRILGEEYPRGYPFERYSPYNGIYQQYMFAHIRKARGGYRDGAR